MKQAIDITDYEVAYEDSWVRCKALSYLHSQFHDQMSRNKDRYSLVEDGYNEVIELIALDGQKVVGLIDVGVYSEERSRHDVYVPHAHQGAYLDSIAVHPDYQKSGIAQSLWNQVVDQLKEKQVDYLTIFTRDDIAANAFYQKNGAQLLTKHYRVLGKPKQDTYKRGRFSVDLEHNRIGEWTAESQPIPFVPDYPHTFWVFEESDLGLFDAESVTAEYTYVLYI